MARQIKLRTRRVSFANILGVNLPFPTGEFRSPRSPRLHPLLSEQQPLNYRKKGLAWTGALQV